MVSPMLFEENCVALGATPNGGLGAIQTGVAQIRLFIKLKNDGGCVVFKSF